MELKNVSDDNQEIETAAAAVAVVATTEQSGIIAQGWKGVELAFKTKKAAIAAYALIFGATVGTATMTVDSTVDEAVEKALSARIQAQQETVVTLETRITELQTQVIEMESHGHEEHDHSAIVGLIDLSKETTPPHAHEFVPHSHNVIEHDHPINPELKAWFDEQSDKFVIHSHGVPDHEHKKTPTVEPANSGEYKHKDSRHDTCARSCHLD